MLRRRIEALLPAGLVVDQAVVDEGGIEVRARSADAAAACRAPEDRKLMP